MYNWNHQATHKIFFLPIFFPVMKVGWFVRPKYKLNYYLKQKNKKKKIDWGGLSQLHSTI